jgi:hypothetical protein
LQHITEAKQGSLYTLDGKEVLSMQSGYVVIVRELNRNEPYPLGKMMTVKASWLVPKGMVYTHGEIP